MLDAKGARNVYQLKHAHAAFARQFPKQIVPLVKIMGKAYRENDIFTMEGKLDMWRGIVDYKGMGGLVVYHKEGTSYARDFAPLSVKLTDARIAMFVKIARKER